jgi:hypothetical protein
VTDQPEPTPETLETWRYIEGLMHSAFPDLDSVLAKAKCAGPTCQPGKLCPTCRNLFVYLKDHVMPRVIRGYKLIEIDSDNGPQPRRITNWH